MVACALLVLGVSGAVMGCSLLTSTGSTKLSTSAINQAIRQVQAALGLAGGAVSRSTQSPTLPSTMLALTWTGGEADVDSAGRIRFILAQPSTGGSSSALPQSQLDHAAAQALAQLGWDNAALSAHGFTAGQGKTVDLATAGPIYETTYAGQDQAGIPNEAVIDVGLDVATGGLREFLFTPGPETAATARATVTEDQALATAKSALQSELNRLVTTTTATLSQASTITSQSAPTTTTSTAPPSISVGTETLVHMNTVRITGGKDRLVWIIKLTTNTSPGTSANVYVDASTGKVLILVVTG